MRETENGSPEQRRGLRRNAAATRQAILDSARALFTQFGYDGVGVREIAQGAGVTAMLVNRYFGSKEQLFAEVVEVTLSAPGILTREVTTQESNRATLSRNVAEALVVRTAPDATPMDGFLILLRSASSDPAAAILREKFTQHFQKPLAEHLPGGQAGERATLFLSLIAGFQVMRQILGMPSLVEAEPSGLVEHLQSLFEVLVKDPEPKRQ
jgi:AcrR family transcriptional regulator